MYCLKNRKALSRDQNINFLRNSGYTATAAVSLDPLQCHVQTWPQTVPQAIVALRAHYVGTACSAHVMKPSQGGREETHLCRRLPQSHHTPKKGGGARWIPDGSQRHLLTSRHFLLPLP
jgi:hypothetical protein